MLKTGYFAQIKKYEGYEPVGIVRYKPKWFTGRNYDIFSPSASLLNRWKAHQVSEEEYTVEYLGYLNENIDSIKSTIDLLISEDKDIVLCCFEKSSDFCHRHLLARFLYEKFGLDVSEFEIS